MLLTVFVPWTRQGEYVREFKQSPRREDDIAIVNAGLRVLLEPGSSVVREAALAFGGVASRTIMAPGAAGRCCCAGAVQELCRSCAGAVQELCRSCAGAVQELCRSCAGAVQEVRLCVLPGWAGVCGRLVLSQQCVSGTRCILPGTAWRDASAGEMQRGRREAVHERCRYDHTSARACMTPLI